MKEKNKDYAAIGSLIRNGLARSGMQQAELAKRIGIQPSSLNQMISGVAPLPIRRFYQIASILNLTQDEIDKAKEFYRNRLLISPEQANQFFVNPNELTNKQGVSTMNELQVFTFNGAAVRICRNENGEPWFVAKDVSDVLGYSDTQAMTRRLDSEELSTCSDNSSGQVRHITVINESGLYSAILGSTKPEAKAFKKWVTGEVLPAILRSGGYMAAKADDTPEEIMARALVIAQDTLKRQEAKLTEQQNRIAEQSRQIAEKTEELAVAAPKVAFVDNFCVSHGTILVRDFAKHIAQVLDLKGFGEKAMFAYLKDNGYLNLNRYPTQRSTEMGLFKVFEGMHQHNDGTTGIHHCSRITTKGQTYFYDKLKSLYETCGRWW